MPHINEQNNFIYFTLSLVLLLLASAVTDYVPDGLLTHLFLRGLIVGMLVVAYLSLNFGRGWRRIVIIVALAQILTNRADAAYSLPYADAINLLFTLAFFMSAAYFAGRRVLLSGRVDGNSIVGSVAVYLLLGLIWATLYLLVLEFVPDSFNGLEHIDWAKNFGNALYFSYVTVTSLGFGDISPTSPLSRTLVYLEAVTGTFYMAIVVASLVGARAKRDSL